MASYADPAAMMVRYDVRTLGDIVSDDGIRRSSTDLLTDANLLAALADASGEIEAALLQGRRYSAIDLSGLTGNTQAYLIRLTCTIAWGLLYERRPSYQSDLRDDALDRAEEALEKLRRGEHIFNLDENKDAGLPEISGPTTVELDRLNLITTQARGHYFPARHRPDNR